MKHFLIALLLSTSSALACAGEDLTITDLSAGEAVVTFNNSFRRCTNFVEGNLTSENGVEVYVRIHVNRVYGNEDDTLIVVPVTPGWEAERPEIDIPEGESGQITVYLGVS